MLLFNINDDDVIGGSVIPSTCETNKAAAKTQLNRKT